MTEYYEVVIPAQPRPQAEQIRDALEDGVIRDGVVELRPVEDGEE